MPLSESRDRFATRQTLLALLALAPVALVPPIGAARPAIAGAVLVPGAIFLDYGARIAFSRSNLTARGLLAASIAYFLRFFCFARDGQEVSQT